MFLSIIIPLFNEEKTILKVLEAISNSGISENVGNYEVIVVDDCSIDNSLQIVNENKNNFPYNISVFSLDKNRGKGYAIREGVKHALGDVILFQDADLELTPNDVPPMIQIMKRLDVSFVNGSRYMAGVIRPIYSYRRYLGNSFFSWLTSFVINLRITDVACAYKLIRKDLLEKINLKENRFGIEAELVIKCMRLNGKSISEVPIQYFPRDADGGKKLKNKDAFNILWTIIKYGLFKKTD